MRRSTQLAKAVGESITALRGGGEPNAVADGLEAALTAYRTRPEGEPEVREAKAKAKAKA